MVFFGDASVDSAAPAPSLDSSAWCRALFCDNEGLLGSLLKFFKFFEPKAAGVESFISDEAADDAMGIQKS
jgi:hypothetical protein